jgi:hypothetical protein
MPVLSPFVEDEDRLGLEDAELMAESENLDLESGLAPVEKDEEVHQGVEETQDHGLRS